MVADDRVPSPLTGLDDDNIETQWQVRHPASVEQGEGGLAQPRLFATIHGLLRQAEVAPSAPPDFHDHEHGWRAWVGRHEIEFVATDMDVPGQDGPASVDESGGDQRFGGVTRLLCGSPTGIESWRIVHGSHHGPGRLPGALLRMHSHSIEHREIQRIEGCRIDHYRNEFSFQQRVGRRRCRRVTQQIQFQLITGERALEGQE